MGDTMNLFKHIGAAVLALGLVGSAQAATVSVVSGTCVGGVGAPGVTCGSAGRTDASAVNLGAADGSFFSLGVGSALTGGIGGYLLLKILPGFTGTNSAIEVTWGNTAAHPEYAEAYVGNTSNLATLLSGTAHALNNLTGVSTIDVGAGAFAYLLLRDVTKLVSPSSPSGDGFDLDAIRITEANANLPVVPAPAALVLLGSAMGALGLLRRRKRLA